jgi:addiction module RelE/StbE family toxin
MIRLVWSPAARRDVAAIAAFVLAHDGLATRKVVVAIRTRAEMLIDHPRIGEPMDLLDLRKLSISGYPYVLIYRVVGNTVQIVRIRHTAEDWRPR